MQVAEACCKFVLEGSLAPDVGGLYWTPVMLRLAENMLSTSFPLKGPALMQHLPVQVHGTLSTQRVQQVHSVLGDFEQGLAAASSSQDCAGGRGFEEIATGNGDNRTALERVQAHIDHQEAC